MKRKFITSVFALTMTASMAMPVFAATSNNQSSEVPVVGRIGRWEDGNTNIENPTNPGSGSQGENGEINKPSNLTDINVTVPTSMTFDVVTNTTDHSPVFATAEYTVTNNGKKPIDMSGQYNVVSAGDINLVEKDAVNAKGGDGNINLALDLNYGEPTANTPFIENVKNGSTSTQKVNINNGSSTKLKFNSDAAGMADIKQEALKGTFATETKTTTGNLVLTFEQK
ncbi:hypothetical protein ACOT7R_16480 [Clostridium perfringens]|uniref:hypothetical protein n=1 Tax=Clostridium perfringens TaxID=1502 RepID=UPI003BA8EE81